MRRVDLTGQRIGLLVVLENSSWGRHSSWLCLCDCGKTKVILTSCLRRGKRSRSKPTRSCGCRKNAKLPDGLVWVKRIYRDYVSKAGVANREWSLSLEEFESLVSGNCHYCGDPPSRHEKKNLVRLFNGVDRVENDKGYTVENCVSCCNFCNVAKRHYTVKEFIERCCRVADHSGYRIKEKE